MYTEEQTGTMTISGEKLRFVSNERTPLAMSFDLEPVQDLHGYEYPWPAGGGINKLPPAPPYSETIRGVTFTSDGNGTYTLKGTATGGSASFNIVLSEPSPIMHEGEYIHARNTTGNGSVTLTLKDVESGASGTSYFGLSPANRILTMNSAYEGVQIKALNFYIGNNTEVYMTIAPSVEATNEVTNFSPYENICPIYGHDEATIYVSPEDRLTQFTDVRTIEFPETVYSGKLTVNEDGSGTINSTVGAKIFDGTENFVLYGADTLNRRFVCYFPQNSNGVICSHGRFIFANAGTWGDFRVYSSANFGVLDNTSHFADENALKTYLAEQYADSTPLTALYELAEPVTIPLTPEQVKTLIGLNYVWTDPKTVITLSFDYRKELQPMALTYDYCWTYPKAYIDKLEARIKALEEASAAETSAAPAAANKNRVIEEAVEETTKEGVKKNG